MSKPTAYFHSALSVVLLLAALVSPALFAQQMPTPTVAVGEVVTTQSAISRRYTGRLVSPARVDLVARVAGEMLEHIWQFLHWCS